LGLPLLVKRGLVGNRIDAQREDANTSRDECGEVFSSFLFAAHQQSNGQ
jgi:hypothetical protein